MPAFYQQRNIDLMKIYDHFGYRSQTAKLVEESKELQEIYRHWVSSDNSPIYYQQLIDELADVFIVFSQLKINISRRDNLNAFYDDFSDAIEAKIKRTLKRIEEGYYEQNQD